MIRKWRIKRALKLLAKLDKENVYLCLNKMSSEEQDSHLKSLTSKLTSKTMHERVYRHLKDNGLK